MLPLKLVGKFLVVFLLCFGLLTWPRPKLEEAYAQFYQYSGNKVFDPFGSSGRVHFHPPPDAGVKSDTAISLMNQQNGARTRFHTNSRFIAYVPTALVVSLILATPIRWRRRLWALLWGLLLINAFIIIRLFLQILGAFSGVILTDAGVALSSDHPLVIFSPGLFWMRCLGFLLVVFLVSSAGNFVVPVFIWALATFRPRDWRKILPRLEK